MSATYLKLVLERQVCESNWKSCEQQKNLSIILMIDKGSFTNAGSGKPGEQFVELRLVLSIPQWQRLYQNRCSCFPQCRLMPFISMDVKISQDQNEPILKKLQLDKTQEENLNLVRKVNFATCAAERNEKPTTSPRATKSIKGVAHVKDDDLCANFCESTVIIEILLAAPAAAVQLAMMMAVRLSMRTLCVSSLMTNLVSFLLSEIPERGCSQGHVMRSQVVDKEFERESRASVNYPKTQRKKLTILQAVDDINEGEVLVRQQIRL
ncbi:hypothetical protein KIN20_015233 [Parelaphostrongylus tenuis]|uniref:Uncharacterized protein n=1 Tax=Parelaphostrongylus tenuis TaxID=148309 RepID=A0AAD5QSD7_PARTN|nr:hypothetical protein KIN20_015233 [Parelaphostrongylus tenuis]